MKKFNIYILLSSLLALLLQGCNDEIVNDPLNGTPLTIQVKTKGYTSADNPQTRTNDDGYTTTFTTGDQIGVFAVKDGKLINENVPYTYDGTSWTGNGFYYKETKYFAYYPYDASLSTNTSITSPDDIVSVFTTKLNATTDQSTYEKYKALDLLMAEVTSTDVNTNSISFTFTHKMALVEIVLPMLKYEFTNMVSSPVYNNATLTLANDQKVYVTPMGNITFDNFQPYSVGNSTYRYLIAPNADKSLYGSYTNENDKKATYTITTTTSSIAASYYKKYQVDGAGEKTKNYTMNIGDFFMNDGRLLSKNTTLTDVQKRDCIGVVFFVGMGGGSGGYFSDNGYGGSPLGQTNCHGYVVALHNAGSGSYQWANNNTTIGTVDYASFQAYTDRKTMETYVTNKGLTMAFFPAANACKNYTPVAPAKTTGWLLPSSKQIQYMKSEVRTSITNAGGSVSNGLYSTTTEYDADKSQIQAAYFGGNLKVTSKSTSYPVRPILAF